MISKHIARLRPHLNRLWFRLTLAFGVVVFLGVVATYVISVISIYVEGEQLDLAEEFSIEDGPIDRLSLYYQQVGSWDDIETVMESIQSIYPANEQASISFSFIDVDDRVLYDAHPDYDESRIEYAGPYYDAIIPIGVEDTDVGYFRIEAYFAENIAEVDNVADLVSGWFQEVWWQILGVGAFVGIFSGVIVSYTLAKPLSRLAHAAEDIGRRDLSRRVQLQGSTEVRSLAQSFNNMVEQLEEAERLRRNMVADVAHELRTPLTVLQGNLRAILDDVYPLTKAEVAGLYDQTRVLSRLVNDLHELSQAEARKLPFAMEDVRLGQLLDNIATIYEPVTEVEDITLSLEIRGELPVYCDSARITQVIQNLLNNAVHHTQSGGKITIRAGRDVDFIYVDVHDTGTGIDSVHLPFVFDRFYRADKSRSRNKGGAGLGLAISKAIIEAHDGSIGVESTGISGEGTTFTVKLPASKKLLQDMRLKTQETPAMPAALN